MNKKAQFGGFAYIFAIIIVVVSVIILVALFPTVTDSFDGLKSSENLNCKSTTDICSGIGSNDTSVCYNQSAGNEHKLTCSFVGFTPAIIFIFLILGLIGLAISGGGREQPQQYPGY